MKTSTLIDSNIVIDVLADGAFFEMSKWALFEASMIGSLILSAIVWAELAQANETESDLRHRLRWLNLRPESFPIAAAFPAGKAHRDYRSRGGLRERTLPDFMIGAHALVAGHRLLTRDPARYRSSFPDLEILSPEGVA